MAYFDPQTRFYKPQLYTWDSLVLETWDSALTWEDYTGSYTSSVGVPDLTYTTDIIDFGRTAWVNPLCSVQSSGTHVIKVYAAESIDSSSQLPGDPVIDTSDSTAVLSGVYGRYFQFVVEVFDGADSYVRAVQTDITAEEQSEFIRKQNSTQHVGTVNERVLPITKSYSKILHMNGSMTTPSRSGDDSTTTSVVDNSGNNTSFGTFGSGLSVIQSPLLYGFSSLQGSTATGSPYNANSIYYEVDNPGAFTWECWAYVQTYNNSLANGILGIRDTLNDITGGIIFLDKDSAADDIYVRSSFDANDSTVSTKDGPNINTGEWHHYAISSNGDTIKVFVDGTQIDENIFEFDSSQQTVRFTLGANLLGNGGNELIAYDEIIWSNTQRYTTNFTPATSSHIVTDNTILYLGGEPGAVSVSDVGIFNTVDMDDANSPSYVIYNTSGTAINGEVSVQVIGLPKMIVNTSGNIVEQ